MKTLAALTLACALASSAAFAGQTGVAIDARGRQIGAYDPSSRSVSVKIAGAWFAMPIGPDGFINIGNEYAAVFYAGVNCQGEAFVDAPLATSLMQRPIIYGDALWYAGTDVQTQAYQSIGNASDAATNSADCQNIDPRYGLPAIPLANVETYPLAKLGFKAPFRLR